MNSEVWLVLCSGWQSRPELGPAVSLSNRGPESTIDELKVLYETAEFAKSTPGLGMVIEEVPINKATTVVVYRPFRLLRWWIGNQAEAVASAEALWRPKHQPLMRGQTGQPSPSARFCTMWKRTEPDADSRPSR